MWISPPFFWFETIGWDWDATIFRHCRVEGNFLGKVIFGYLVKFVFTGLLVCFSILSLRTFCDVATSASLLRRFSSLLLNFYALLFFCSFIFCFSADFSPCLPFDTVSTRSSNPLLELLDITCFKIIFFKHVLFFPIQCLRIPKGIFCLLNKRMFFVDFSTSRVLSIVYIHLRRHVFFICVFFFLRRNWNTSVHRECLPYPQPKSHFFHMISHPLLKCFFSYIFNVYFWF